VLIWSVSQNLVMMTMTTTMMMTMTTMMNKLKLYI